METAVSTPPPPMIFHYAMNRLSDRRIGQPPSRAGYGRPGPQVRALIQPNGVQQCPQNLLVEPERNADGMETGFYFVTIGEDRGLTQLLRASRKQIKKTRSIINSHLGTEKNG